MSLNTKTIPMSGKLITSVDGTQIGDNFSIVENLRYDPTFKGIKGMTKINTTPLTDLDIKSGHHFKKTDPQQESHVLAQSFTGPASKLYDNPGVIPNQGNFTALHTDASGATVGRFANTPVESMLYCNGEESLIWSGDKFKIGSFLIASTGETASNFIFTNRADYVNHTPKIRNTLTSDFARLPDSQETQVFIGSTQRLKSINFQVSSGSPDRYTTPSILFYNGSAWVSVSNLVDTTAIGGFTLKQSGSYTFDDTQGTVKPLVLDSIQLYWYRITFGSYVSIAGNIDIEHVDVSANIQPLSDLWDGKDIPLAVAKRDEGNDVVNIAENNYDTNNNATWLSLEGSMGQSEIPIPDNITNATGMDEFNGSFFVLSQDELKIFEIDDIGSAISEIDVSSFYSDVPTDGLPVGISVESDSLHGSATVGKAYSDSYSIYLTGTKKILHLSKRGKFIAEFLNTVYDAAAGTSTGLVKIAKDTFFVVDETTGKIYSTTANFTPVFTTVLGFTPGGITKVDGLTSITPSTDHFFNIFNKNVAEERQYSGASLPIQTISLPAIAKGGTEEFILYSPSSGVGRDVISKLNPAVGSSRAIHVNRLTIGSFQRLAGIKINFIPCNTNIIPITEEIDVKGNTNTSTGSVSVNSIIDKTRKENKPFNQSGTIVWNPLSEQEEVKVSLEGLSMYKYEVFLDAHVSVNTKAYYIAGIPASRDIHPHSFPINAHDRVWLCDDTKGQRNSILTSGKFTDSVYNGEDSTELLVGDSNPVVSGASVTKGLIVCKHSETWLISGNTPANFILTNLSREIGCSNPLTMKSVNLKTPDGSLLQVAVWQDTEGVYISEGQSITKVSFDIESLFKPDSATRINNIGISSAFFDVTNKEYHLLYPEIGSNVINREIVFDIEHKVWYTINRQSKILSAGFITNDTLGNYNSYGVDNSGTVYRLENGTTFDGSSITHILKTGDIRLTGENVIQTILRRVNLLQKAKNVTPNKINGTHFGDTSTSGGTFTMNIAEAGKRVMISRADVNFGIDTFHSIQLSMTTDNEVSGFEPLEIVLYFTPARKDKI